MWPTLGDDPQNPNHNLHEDHHVGPRAEAPELSTFGHQYGGREGNVSHIWRFTRKWVMSMNTCDSLVNWENNKINTIHIRFH